MPEMIHDDDALLAQLGVEAEPVQAGGHSAQEERIIAGFEDILRFWHTHGRAPQHGVGRDIFERLYAVRLEQLRQLPDASILLSDLDAPGLLLGNSAENLTANGLSDDEILANLDVAVGSIESDIQVLRHVRSHIEIKAAEEVASRVPCKDFADFAARFAEAKAGLQTGAWQTAPFVADNNIQVGDFYIVGGQIAYIADMGAGTITKDGRDNPRLRVIFDNQTEANLLLRSLSRSLYPDGNTPVGRRLVKFDNGPLFADTVESDDIQSGTIYVLRSRSNHPFVTAHRKLIHKIGVTGGAVQVRIRDAANDATYLLAGVDIVATYQLHNIKRSKIENLFHRLFAAAQLDLTIADRFGQSVRPREWFCVPLPVIDEAVCRIIDGSITRYSYDPATAALVKV